MNGRPIVRQALIYAVLQQLSFIAIVLTYAQWHQQLDPKSPLYLIGAMFVLALPLMFLFNCPRCGTSAFKIGKASLDCAGRSRREHALLVDWI